MLKVFNYQYILLSLALQYADPVADLLDKWGVFKSRLFRESCVFHRGNYVKVSIIGGTVKQFLPRDIPKKVFGTIVNARISNIRKSIGNVVLG